MGQLRDQKIERLNKPIYFFDAHFPPPQDRKMATVTV